MRLPTKVRSLPPLPPLSLLAAACIALLGACAGEITAPAPTSLSASSERISPFSPSPATRALIGVADGTYAVTFDPTRNQTFSLGPNHLDIPAYSVCNLLTSGYGAAYWNTSCSPQTHPVTLTVIIKNAQSVHPSIQFFPAMRFDPTKSVDLYMYAPHVSKKDAKNWLMLYCNDSRVCVDESITDSALRTFIDYNANVVFRRVKHFSGYVVAERADSTVSP